MRQYLTCIVLLGVCTAAEANEQFKYHSPGRLIPTQSGSGNVANRRIYAPDMGLPIRLASGQHIYANSQVWRKGGSQGGNQCDTANYSMPWVDDFCEKRSRPTPMCPSATGHQGQDIRPPVCKAGAVDAIAVTDGSIIGVNPYTSSVTLKATADGTVYMYLHLKPETIKVKVGDRVQRGQELGKVSNFMNGKVQTTVHLHFEVMQNVIANGRVSFINVPPFSSLVHAHRKWLGLPDMNNGGALRVDSDHEL